MDIVLNAFLIPVLILVAIRITLPCDRVMTTNTEWNSMPDSLFYRSQVEEVIRKGEQRTVDYGVYKRTVIKLGSDKLSFIGYPFNGRYKLEFKRGG